MADGVGIAPTQPEGSLGFQDRGITALPTIHMKLAAKVGLAPTPNGLIPIQNRDYFDTTWQWRCRQDFHLHRSA